RLARVIRLRGLVVSTPRRAPPSGRRRPAVPRPVPFAAGNRPLSCAAPAQYRFTPRHRNRCARGGARRSGTAPHPTLVIGPVARLRTAASGSAPALRPRETGATRRAAGPIAHTRSGPARSPYAIGRRGVAPGRGVQGPSSIPIRKSAAMRREPRALFRTPGPRSIGLAFVLAALFAACRQVDTVRDHFRPESPHAAYAYALSQAGLASAALVRDWIHAAEHALREPHYVRLPYRETGWFPPERPTAVSYRWSARRGQRLVVELELATDDSALVFLDLYRIPGDASRPPHRVLSADSGRTRLEYAARRDADYLLRIQPELLRGGRYTITILATASLAFPVSGRGNHDIGGPFGAPRSGGRRHHGIDIFAPRGTPVVAAAAGTVTRVAETPIGGKVVWLRDELRGQSLYYAHLDRQVVEPGMRVGIGD